MLGHEGVDGQRGSVLPVSGGLAADRVDGLARDDLRSLGVAVRDQPGIRAAVLIGAPEGGGVALVAATAVLPA